MSKGDSIVTPFQIEEFRDLVTSPNKAKEIIELVSHVEPELMAEMNSLCQEMLHEMEAAPLGMAYKSVYTRMTDWCVGFFLGLNASAWEHMGHIAQLTGENKISDYVNHLMETKGLSGQEIAEKFNPQHVLKIKKSQKSKKLKF
jgi:hypothetical protein